MQRLIPAISSQCAHKVDTASYPPTVAYLRTRLPAALLTVVVMLLLKRHYSLATAEQLDWVLAPTAGLVAWCTAASPVLENGVGYVDPAQGIIVAPACAGINFMIMAFGLAAFCGLNQIRRPAGQLVWLALAFATAYCLTLPVNAVRIALSLTLYQADIYTGWLTAERVHRLAGIGLYLGALWLLYLGLRRIIARFWGRFDQQDQLGLMRLPGCLVVGWYLIGTLGVPLANGAWRRGASAFGEHCVTVVLASLALCSMVWLVSHLSTASSRRSPGRLPGSGTRATEPAEYPRRF